MTLSIKVAATRRQFFGVGDALDAKRQIGQVAERLMAADCKSAAPCGLRRFESSPVHVGVGGERPTLSKKQSGPRSSVGRARPW
jgi:hypothetical protein